MSKFDEIFDRAFKNAEKKIAFRESLKNLPENSWLKAEMEKQLNEKKTEKEIFHEGKTFEEFYADFCKKYGKELGDRDI